MVSGLLFWRPRDYRCRSIAGVERISSCLTVVIPPPPTCAPAPPALQRWTWQTARTGRCSWPWWCRSPPASWRAGRPTGWGGGSWTGGRSGCKTNCQRLRRNWTWLERSGQVTRVGPGPVLIGEVIVQVIVSIHNKPYVYYHTQQYTLI